MDDQVASNFAGTPSADTPSTTICAGCETSLVELPATARFCPSCGMPLPAADLPAAPATIDTESRAIRASYAAALYRLGWRYEAGSPRIAEEAARCYMKAARLGNQSAQVRLDTAPTCAPAPEINDAPPLVPPPAFSERVRVRLI